MKKQQTGFTLIELVMVIVILGILSAVAIPKFIDLSTEAKTSAAKGLAAGLSSAFAVNYAAYVISVTTPGSSWQPISIAAGTLSAWATALMQANGFSLPAGMSLARSSQAANLTLSTFNCLASAGSTTQIWVSDGTNAASSTLICTG